MAHDSHFRNSHSLKLADTVIICTTLVLFISYNCVSGQQNTTQSRLRACVYDSDCVENAYCVNRTYCLCKEHFIIHMGPQGAACLREAIQVGDPCDQDLQCTKPFGIYAFCGTDSRCQCNRTAHFKEGRCYETAGLGKKCKVSNNCRINSEVAVFCDKSVCVCPRRHHPNSYGTDCLKSAYIGEPCTSDDTCLSPNSRCREVCRCRVNFVESRDEKICLQVADRVGDPCQEDSQCGEFLKTAECLNGTCRCSKYYHSLPSSTVCWRDVALGGACTSNNECVVTTSAGKPVPGTCKQGTCQCASGYTSDPTGSCRTTSGSRQQTQQSISIVSLSLSVVLIITYRTLGFNIS